LYVTVMVKLINLAISLRRVPHEFPYLRQNSCFDNRRSL
jgi:hypothetical protein